MYLGDSEGAGASIGVSGLTTGDVKGQSTAIADYINDHGGVAGRTIALSFAPVSSMSCLLAWPIC